MKIFLIVIDTLRADHLSCYGYFRDTSPNIDRLVKEGVIFENFHASAIPTGPGFTSIITGLFPIQNKFYFNPHNLPNIKFDDDIPTLAEMIWENGGYTTAAFDNLINFRSHMDQFVRGFEYYINVTRTAMPKQHLVVGGEINRRLLPWIRSHSEEDIFVFIHYWEPHTPYNQPEGYRDIFKHKKGNLSDLKVCKAPAGYEYVPGWGKVGELWEEDLEEKKGDVLTTERRTIDLYDGEIKYLDYLISQIVKTIKEERIDKDSIIILTADHGEQLGQHGMYGHAGLHEANTLIPFIAWGPGQNIPQGKKLKGYAQHTDIVPTVLDLITAEKRPEMAGESLLQAMNGKEPLREEVFMEGYLMRGIIRKSWKYIWHLDGREELYNMEKDPMEVINLSDKEKEIREGLRCSLERWVYKNLHHREDPIVKTERIIRKAKEENSYTSITKLPWL